MNDLRLIILIIGLCFIVLTYFWETRKQRREQRRQTVNYIPPESGVPEFKIKPAGDGNTDYASVISDLNEALNKNRQQEDEAISRILNTDMSDARVSSAHVAASAPPAIGDLFPDVKQPVERGKEMHVSGDPADIREEHIISLFVTAPAGGIFSAEEIFKAAGDSGLEFGDLDIFHHYGEGAEKMVRPLFSMADMYEPGSFDPESKTSRTTRGLSLFMCLPTPVNDTRAFELMLETTRHLAEILDGQVMGSDRKPLNKEHVRSIYKIINAQA